LQLFPISSGSIGVPLPVARIQLESIFGKSSAGQDRSTAVFLDGAGHQTAEVIRIGPNFTRGRLRRCDHVVVSVIGIRVAWRGRLLVAGTRRVARAGFVAVGIVAEALVGERIVRMRHARELVVVRVRVIERIRVRPRIPPVSSVSHNEFVQPVWKFELTPFVSPPEQDGCLETLEINLAVCLTIWNEFCCRLSEKPCF
jgi:hypothetical protein